MIMMMMQYDGDVNEEEVMVSAAMIISVGCEVF